MDMDTVKLIESLFRWKMPILIGDTTLYLRIVSDAVLEDARHHALLAARKLRKAMRDPEGDEYLIHLDSMHDADMAELVVSILNMKVRSLAREYLSMNAKPVVPELSDNASQEEQERHLTAKEERDASYLEAMQAHLEAWQADYTTVLNAMSREDLERIYKKERTDKVCEDAFTEAFEFYVLAHSLYLDEACKRRAFTLEEFRDIPTGVKGHVRDTYNALSISSDSLKN
jgi:hypothetical protein